jgi:hypothetical protein
VKLLLRAVIDQGQSVAVAVACFAEMLGTAARVVGADDGRCVVAWNDSWLVGGCWLKLGAPWDQPFRQGDHTVHSKYYRCI